MINTHPTVERVTDRIRQRNRATRSSDLQRLAGTKNRDRSAGRMGCANLTHAVAGVGRNDKFTVVSEGALNIGSVTAYNDMLSAYPDIIKHEARKLAPLRRWLAACRRCATE